MRLPPAGPIVYAITEGHADDSNFPEQKIKILSRIRRAADRGITAFQIREKRLSAALLDELVREALGAASGSGLKIVVNGRFDIALAAGADGVHLPADGLPVDAVRSRVPKDFLIGVSTHTIEEAVAAQSVGADMIVFGPVFPSPGKGDGVGLEMLGEVCRAASPMPVLALGGVDETTYRLALEMGAAGFASIRFLNSLIERGEDLEI